MPSLTELYKSIYEKLNSIASEYADAQSRLTSSIQEDTVAKNKRICKNKSYCTNCIYYISTYW